MNPWQELLDRIEPCDDECLTTFLDRLSDLGRKVVAGRLSAHLSEELRGGFEARWDIEELASGYRLAGAACLPGAEQVATWLNRRELREPRAPEQDAARMVSLLRRRPLEWRRELAVRLAGRLRPPAGGAWRRGGGMPGWELVAALVSETGIEPPDGDAFVAGWVSGQVWRRRVHGDLLVGDPLLDALLPRLFEARGVAAPLVRELRWDLGQEHHRRAGGTGRQGRVPRATLIGGCVRRFMAGRTRRSSSGWFGCARPVFRYPLRWTGGDR